MRAKIMLLPATSQDQTLCDYAEHILIDVSAAFDHSFSLMREKIGELSKEAYGETLTEETVENCRNCRAVFLCDGDNSGQELYDALDVPLRIRSLCVPEILCARHQRPATLYVGTVLSLDAETLRRAMRIAFRGPMKRISAWCMCRPPAQPKWTGKPPCGCRKPNRPKRLLPA